MAKNYRTTIVGYMHKKHNKYVAHFRKYSDDG